MKMMKKLKGLIANKKHKAKEKAMSAYQKLVSLKTALAMMMMALSLQAQAALPAEAKAALEGAKTDGLEAGWIVVGVVAALFVIKIVKSLIR